MADYVSILNRAIDALEKNTLEQRELVYSKARSAMDRKLRGIDPALPETVIAAQLNQLNDAIANVEIDRAIADLTSGSKSNLSEAPVAAPPIVEPAAAKSVETAAPPQINPPVNEVTPAIQPVEAPRGFIDDVSLIDGIGVKTASSLAAEGITSLTQIASMSAEELETITQRIGVPGWEKTQEWQQQSRDMISGELPRSKTDSERFLKLLAEIEGRPEATGSTSVSPETPDAALSPVTKKGSQATRDALAHYSSKPDLASTETIASRSTTKPVMAPQPPEHPAQPTQTDFDIAANSAAPSVQASRPVLPMATPATRFVNDAAAPRPPVTAAPPVAESRPAIPEQAVPSNDYLQSQPQPMRGAAAQTPPDYISDIDLDNGVERPLAGSGAKRVKPKSGRVGKSIGWLAGLLLLGGAAYAGYTYRDQLTEIGMNAKETVTDLLAGADANVQKPDAGTSEEIPLAEKDSNRLGTDAEPVDAEKPIAEETPIEQPTQLVPPADTQEPVADGKVEVVETEPAREPDPAPAVTEDSPAQPGPEIKAEETVVAPTTDTPAAIVAGEKAFLYEESPGASGANRDEGSMVWSIVQEPPEAGMPAESIIRGNMEIPGRGLSMLVNIKRNVDEALPATHVIELLFTALPEFSGGNVDNISRFVMKNSEQARGESLVGVPARIDVGYFLLALNNLEQAKETNLNLLENSSWIDLPVGYTNGRRALLAFEKGESGDKIFKQALADWKNR